MATDTPAVQTCVQSVTWLWQFWGDPHTEFSEGLFCDLQSCLRGVNQPARPDANEQCEER